MKTIHFLSFVALNFLLQSLICIVQPGPLDLTFNGTGMVFTASNLHSARAVATQSDGKILVAGSREMVSTNTDFGIVRYNNNGSLDSTFGNNGIVSTDFSNGWDAIRSMVIQNERA
jgi:uncharacterized delta-60 repeat protein